MKLTKKGAAAILLAALAIIILGTPAVRLREKSLAVVINLLIPTGSWRPLELFTRDPIKETHILSVIDDNLIIPSYIPRKPADTAMIIYTPFIGGGAEDLRLLNLANTFTRAGFLTVTPFRENKELIVSASDKEDVIAAAKFILNKYPEIKNLGIFGISYGNGPAITASADPRIKESVKFIISFSGFYDFDSTINFIKTGKYSYKDISGQINPHPYALEILGNSAKKYNLNLNEFLDSAALKNIGREISPSLAAGQLMADFFILHSTDDAYIPYTESMRLHDELRDRPNAITEFALTTVFEHGVYKIPTAENIREHYIPSFKDFYRLIYLILEKHL